VQWITNGLLFQQARAVYACLNSSVETELYGLYTTDQGDRQNPTCSPMQEGQVVMNRDEGPSYCHKRMTTYYWNCHDRRTCFVVIWKHFCFILSTGTKIRI